MKVLMICNSDAALYRFRAPIINKLNRVNANIITISGDTGYSERLSNIVTKNYSLKMYGNESIFNVLSVIKKVTGISKKEKPNAIHGFTHFGNLCALFSKIAVREANLVMSITGMGRVFDQENKGIYNKFLSFIILGFYKYSARYCNKIIVQNRDDFDLLLRKVDQRKLVLQGGSGIDINEEQSRNPTSKKIKVLMASRAVEAKGFREYFEAAKFLNRTKHKKDYEFYFAGGDSLDNPFDDSLSELAQQSGVKYLGYILDIEQLMQECDVIVLPSYYREGVPRSLIEALYHDKFIITTNSVGCKETVIDGWNGLLVEKRNVNSLISALIKITPDYLNDRIYRSSTLCKIKFDGSRLAEETLSFYNSKVGK